MKPPGTQPAAVMSETDGMFDSLYRHALVTVADERGRIIDANAAFCAISGHTREELLGQDHRIVNSGQHPREFWSDLWRGLRAGSSWRGEICNRAKDGSLFWVDSIITPFFGADGCIAKYISVHFDITAHKLVQRRLQESEKFLERVESQRRILDEQFREAIGVAQRANKAKSEFLANMSHEIRTPLNAVIGLGYLLEQTALSEDQRQFLIKIQFAGRALLGVVNNVLDLSKIEAGEMLLEDEPFALAELARDLGQMLTPQAQEKSIELVVQAAPDLPAERGDVTRLRQILINLVNNSIKFTEKGRVSLTVSATERSVDGVRLRCVVEDTGIGIEAAALERLFTPFTQADASTTRRFGGTGLGLSITRRFVELMGGEIGVSSTVAAGSTFWIEIPLRLDRALTDAAHAHGEAGLRIFIADSRGDVPDGLGAMVRALGWTPQVAETAQQLLGFVGDAQPGAWPDMLLLNLHLPGADAHRLIDELKATCIQGDLPPVIVVADYARQYLEFEPFLRPTDAVLVRPVTSSALFNAINSSIWRRHDGHERILQSTNFDELHAQWLAGVRVLVVDDSDINLEVARRILERQGAVVATCSDGAQALEQVGSTHEQLDVVLMDVQMPVLDGNEATRRIRRELGLARLPIVALTAGALVGERQRALEAGMSDFVSKPFDPQALIRIVRRLAEQARGAPIPMVILDAKPAAPAGDRPFMASIDAGVVQQMFGDDLTLFRSLLARMLRDYADLAVPSSVHDSNRRGELTARTHKLKGSAGMVGATRIMRLAGAAERALEEDRPPDVLEGILAQLAAALVALREEAQPFFESQPAVQATTGQDAGHGPANAADIEELCALLESQNLAAVDQFTDMSQALQPLLGEAGFERLRSAVEDLDFRLAADQLAALRAPDARSRRTAAGG